MVGGTLHLPLSPLFLPGVATIPLSVETIKSYFPTSVKEQNYHYLVMCVYQLKERECWSDNVVINEHKSLYIVSSYEH